MKLLEQVRQTARVKHFSYRTEKAYVYWAERYIRFHGIRHPNLLGTAEIEQFLTHLAVEGHVSASTQNQALAALLFMEKAATRVRSPLACLMRSCQEAILAAPSKKILLFIVNKRVFCRILL